jgi:hypothetical protein
MNNKSRHLNVISATALAASSTTISPTQSATWGRGIRFYITVAAVTLGGGTDSIYLCAVPPRGGVAIPLAGFSGVNALAVAGQYMIDFYPGAWLPAAGVTLKNLIAVFGLELPMNWAIQIGIGAGNAATITVDAEMMP